MKTPGQAAFMALCLIFLGACSSIKVSQDYDTAHMFSQLKTFALVSKPLNENGDVRTESPLVHERIRRAITSIMGDKGFIQTDTNPDVMVSYHYTIRTKITSTTSGPRMGLILGSSGRDSAFAFGAETDTSTYDEGMLVIDFKTGKEGQTLWRGTSTFNVETHVKPEKMTKKIHMAVQKTLDQFPPKQK